MSSASGDHTASVYWRMQKRAATQPVLYSSSCSQLGDADAEPPVPLSDNEIAALAGTYVFGLGVSQQIELTVDQRQGVPSMYSPLTWTRTGTIGRPLVYLGDRAFYPAGAPSVRVRFAVDKGSVVMTVSDPELVLAARRKQELK